MAKKIYTENSLMDTGKYAGWRILDVPMAYLKWYMQTTTYFNKPNGYREVIADRVLNDTDNKFHISTDQKVLNDWGTEEGAMLFLVIDGKLVIEYYSVDDVISDTEIRGLDLTTGRKVDYKVIEKYAPLWYTEKQREELIKQVNNKQHE